MKKAEEAAREGVLRVPAGGARPLPGARRRPRRASGRRSRRTSRTSRSAAPRSRSRSRAGPIRRAPSPREGRTSPSAPRASTRCRSRSPRTRESRRDPLPKIASGGELLARPARARGRARRGGVEGPSRRRRAGAAARCGPSYSTKWTQAFRARPRTPSAGSSAPSPPASRSSSSRTCPRSRPRARPPRGRQGGLRGPDAHAGDVPRPEGARRSPGGSPRGRGRRRGSPGAGPAAPRRRREGRFQGAVERCYTASHRGPRQEVPR